MKSKMIPVTLFFLILLSFPCLTAYAGDDMNDMIGVVTANDGGRVDIVSAAEDGSDLNRSCLVADAGVYDLLTGLPVYPDEIREGMLIRVFTDDGDNASVVWLNFREDGAAAFKATVSENIQYDGDECRFLTGDDKYRVTLTPETEVFDPAYGYISAGDIQPGDEMFVWVDMVTASFPAQAYPDQVVLIR